MTHRSGLLVLFVLSSQSFLAAAPLYTLSFHGARRFEAESGTRVDLASSFTVRLTESENVEHRAGIDPVGAQGWAISIAGEGVVIDAMSPEGTDAEARLSDGFTMTSLIHRAQPDSACDGHRGATHVCVLSFGSSTSLAVDTTSSLAVVHCSGSVVAPDVYGDPDPRGLADVPKALVGALRFADGCQGLGQPVRNAVTWNGETMTPQRDDCLLFVVQPTHPAPCPSPEHAVQATFSNAEVHDPEEPASLVAEISPFETSREHDPRSASELPAVSVIRGQVDLRIARKLMTQRSLPDAAYGMPSPS